MNKKIISVLMFTLLTSSASWAAAKTKFIYGILENSQDKTVTVFINTTKVWKAEGHLTDNYTNAERKALEPILDAANLCELQESTYEPCRGQSAAEIKLKLDSLKKLGIGFDQSFQDFVDTF